MAQKKPKLPKFVGELAKPLDSHVVFPPGEEHYAEYSEKHFAELDRLRLRKIPLLARFLGIKFEHLDLSKTDDLASFYHCLAMNLAILICPGFRPRKPGKTPREIVRWLLMAIEKGKASGMYKSDLDGCTDFLKKHEPELARPLNRTVIQKRARTLRNLVAQDRACLKRAHAKKLH
jgi:hypothetical protein